MERTRSSLGSFDGMGIRSLFSAAICAVYFDGPARPPQIKVEVSSSGGRRFRWSACPVVIPSASLVQDTRARETAGGNDASRRVTLIATCSLRNYRVIAPFRPADFARYSFIVDDAKAR